MTSYRRDELEQGWEFKIVRSAIGAFRAPKVLAQTVDFERIGSWELVEIFDYERLRFRRPVSARNNDASLPHGYYPYRTQHGMSEGALALWVILVIFGFMALLLGGLFLAGVL